MDTRESRPGRASWAACGRIAAHRLTALTAAAALALAACGNGATGPSDRPAVFQQPITSSGFACPAPEFQAPTLSGELNLLVRTEYLSSEIQDCFELVFGVAVRRREYSVNEGIIQRLSAADADHDLVLAPDYIVSQLIRQAALTPLDHRRLPLASNLDPDYLNFTFDPGNQYSVPYQAGSNAIIVNTATVRRVPRSWADLWSREYAGRLISLDDSRTLIGAALLTLGHDVNTTDPAQLEAARLKLLELIPNIRLFDNDSPKTILGTGGADLGITWTGEAYLAQQSDPAIEYIYPAEGAIVWQDSWVIPEGAEHIEAAYAFLNYSMQGNVFWVTLRDFPYVVPNLAALDYARIHQAPIYEAYAGSPITNMPAGVIADSHRIGDVGESLALYYEIWTELRAKR
jgi:spermidine/putrescine-binding protein